MFSFITFKVAPRVLSHLPRASHACPHTTAYALRMQVIDEEGNLQMFKHGSKKPLSDMEIAAPKANPAREDGETWKQRDRRNGAGWNPKEEGAGEEEGEEGAGAGAAPKKKIFDVNDPKFQDQYGARDLMTELAKQAGGPTGTNREATVGRLASWDTGNHGKGVQSSSILGQTSQADASAEGKSLGGDVALAAGMSTADMLAALEDCE